jgi:hypothetical protein
MRIPARLNRQAKAHRPRATFQWFAGLLLLLAGCSGIPATPTAAVQGGRPNARTHTKVPVVMKMAFPQRKSRRHGRRRTPLFVSQYTKTVEFSIGGPTPFNHTYAITDGSAACPTAGKTTTCSWTIDFAPGSYLFTIVARDAAKNILSETENVPEKVAAGRDNLMHLTMYAVPTSIQTFLNGNAVLGNIIDLGVKRTFSVYPFSYAQSGGYIQVITGAGTPTLVVKRISGTMTPQIVQPSGSPPTFTVSAPGTASLGLATLVVNATFPSSDQNLCELPGANCTSGPMTFNAQEIVGVCCTNGVQLFGIDGSGPLATVGSAASGISAFAFDRLGDLFVAKAAGSVDEYAPPYAAPIATLSSGIDDPIAIALSDDGNLFVANAGASPQSITEYVPPYANATPSATITNGIALQTPPANAPQLALQNGVSAQQPLLLVANPAGVNAYSYPYSAEPTAIQNALDGVAIGPFGVLYALTPSGPSFCTFSSGCQPSFGTVSNAYTIAVPRPSNVSSTPFAFVASTDGNVYAFNTNNATPLTIAGLLTGLPQLMPLNIATDPAGSLAIVDYQNNDVLVYTGASAKGTSVPSFSATVKLSQNVHAPTQVQILP